MIDSCGPNSISQPGDKIYDFVVSSYIPSLSILAPSNKAYLRLAVLKALKYCPDKWSRSPLTHTHHSCMRLGLLNLKLATNYCKHPLPVTYVKLRVMYVESAHTNSGNGKKYGLGPWIRLASNAFASNNVILHYI